MKILGVITLGVALGLTGMARAEADPPSAHTGVDQSKKELGGIRKKIQEEKQRVKDISKKESSVISHLNVLDRNLSEKDKELKALKQKLTTVDRKVQKANQDLGLLTGTIDSQESMLLDRLVALYKFGDAGMPQLLFSSRSYEDFMSARRYLTSILEQDRQLVDDYRKRKTVVGDYRRQLKEDEQELQSLKKKTEQKKSGSSDRLVAEKDGFSIRSGRRNRSIWPPSRNWKLPRHSCRAWLTGWRKSSRKKPRRKPSFLPERGLEASGESCLFR